MMSVCTVLVQYSTTIIHEYLALRTSKRFRYCTVLCTLQLTGDRTSYPFKHSAVARSTKLYKSQRFRPEKQSKVN